jgi:predicted  nucleic acid-binding Zn-ribbon protein
MSADLTIEILREIRDGIGALRDDFNARLDQTNQRLDQTNQQLDQTNQRLDQTNERLGRVEGGLSDLGKFMRQIALDQAKHERFHSHHVERLEDDVAHLKDRVLRLEKQAGGTDP